MPYTTYGSERVDSPLHRQLAYEAALQGIVLLQARRWGGRMGGEAALQGIVLLQARSGAQATAATSEVWSMPAFPSPPQNNASSSSPNGPGTPSLPLQRSRLAGALEEREKEEAGV